MTSRIPCVIIALAACIVGSARADAPPAPPTAADISYARSLSIAASRGLAGGNEGIFLNAASLAARRRYSIELQWALDRAGATNRNQFFGASVVDSQMTAVTGGMAYTHMATGPTTGDIYSFAMAGRVSDHLFAGATGKYLSLGGLDPANAVTMDASLFYALPMFSLGVSGYNLIDTNHDQQAPRGVGTGIAIGNERKYNITVDYRADFDRRGKTTNAWAAGAELLAFRYFPLRGGFLRDEARDGKWWTAGLGFVHTSGVALDLAYQQSLDFPSARTLALGLKLFLLAQQ